MWPLIILPGFLKKGGGEVPGGDLPALTDAQLETLGKDAALVCGASSLAFDASGAAPETAAVSAEQPRASFGGGISVSFGDF